MRSRMVVLVLVLVAVGMGVLAASAAGRTLVNQKKLCEGDGWHFWLQADATPFKSQKACKSYAKHGSLMPKSKADCESVGATYDLMNQTGFTSGTLVFSCNGTGVTSPFSETLANDCLGQVSGGVTAIWQLVGSAGIPAMSCFRISIV